MRNINRTVLFTLLTVGGCSQIIGLSDYEVDSRPGASAGESSSEGGDAGSQGGETTAHGGADNTAGTRSTGGDGNEGGEPSTAGGAPPMTAGSAGEAGAPPVAGTLVPCDSSTCCNEKGGTAVGVELLGDGGFELGPVDDGNTPWTETSKKGYAIITDGVQEDVKPHKGGYFAWLAGITNEKSDLESENLTIPADAGWIVLSGYRNFDIDSLDTDTTNEDFLGIGFYTADDTTPLELPFYWDKSDPGETASWTKFQAEWDAAPHAGQDRYLLLRGSTDAYVGDPDTTISSSNYMFDDLSLKVFRCYE